MIYYFGIKPRKIIKLSITWFLETCLHVYFVVEFTNYFFLGSVNKIKIVNAIFLYFQEKTPNLISKFKTDLGQREITLTRLQGKCHLCGWKNYLIKFFF